MIEMKAWTLDVLRISGWPLFSLRQGKEKIINQHKGAKVVTESTKGDYAKNLCLISEMTRSSSDKKSLPMGPKTLDKGKLMFFKSEFTVVLSTLDKRREMLN